jgi:hypothetical protein
MMLQTIAQFLTVLSCGLFAGAAVYITLVERSAAPSWLRRSSGLAIGVRPSCRLAEHRWGWLLGGILLVAVIPFTLLASGRPTPSCWIRRLTEVRSRRGSFFYDRDDCMFSLVVFFEFAHPKIILAGLGFPRV